MGGEAKLKRDNLNSHIDLHTHSGSALNNLVTLTFDNLSLTGSMHAERLSRTICPPTLV